MEVLTHAPTGRNLEDIMLIEINQSQKVCRIPYRRHGGRSDGSRQKAEVGAAGAGAGGGELC